MSEGVVTDVLGEPWLAETLTLADDDEGTVVATLVRRSAAEPSPRAVLHVHGFADYFFQVEYAQWWLDRGYDVYALDLRKYGRSLREDQTRHYVDDLRTYDEELEEAWRRITQRDGHDHVVLSAHSTGGLVASWWAHRHRPASLAGLVLNSPWLDLQGSLLLRTVGAELVKQLGRRQPRRSVGRRVSGFYVRSLHRDHEGEFDFDLAWKPVQSTAVYFGWLRAVLVAQAALHAGLDVRAPVLVLSSARSTRPQEMGEDVHSSDVVLDVRQIRRWSTSIGAHVTSVAIDGARHDVALSREEARARVYGELARWCDAYLG